MNSRAACAVWPGALLGSCGGSEASTTDTDTDTSGDVQPTSGSGGPSPDTADATAGPSTTDDSAEATSGRDGDGMQQTSSHLLDCEENVQQLTATYEVWALEG